MQSMQSAFTPLTDGERTHLLAAIDLAAGAREHGNHPFGALLTDPAGNVLLTAENTVLTEHDVTCHAETNLVRLATRTLTPDQLATATLYTSTEPCPMCSGAIYWSGIPRVVYALAATELNVIAAADPDEPLLDLPCRQVFAAGGNTVAVSGPHLFEESAAVHEGFWA
ncbi:nucleoside deaminase [Streptacidiphilus jiangxiensis]|uniref:tRNA(Arg) A34 adenosine deaminase TadA n=1 Tax=Streptacidiphilus jiangxiensis TaxID=235985 RepID=A0A1H7TUC7_STRJI|nr:nucleoside deaminase [Streptacidiphilus jiangxiensis]SEL88480.1 tRNA(Arg) A34 adenosine deaminase TadA [Streptacidiphilus jiangxiensis]